MIFLEDNELKLVCSFGVAICNSHLQSTVACTAWAGECWKWSETYANEARRIGWVGSLLADLGRGAENSSSDSWLRDCILSYCAEAVSGLSSSGVQCFRTLRCCRLMLWCSKSKLSRYTRSSFSLLYVARSRGLSECVGQRCSAIWEATLTFIWALAICNLFWTQCGVGQKLGWTGNILWFAFEVLPSIILTLV